MSRMSYVSKMCNRSIVIYFQLTIFTQNSVESTVACLELTMSIYAHKEFIGITNRPSSGEMMSFVNEYTVIIRILQTIIENNCPLKISFVYFPSSFIHQSLCCSLFLLLLFVFDFLVSNSVQNIHVGLSNDGRVWSFDLANLIDGSIENGRRARPSL